MDLKLKITPEALAVIAKIVAALPAAIMAAIKLIEWLL